MTSKLVEARDGRSDNGAPSPAGADQRVWEELANVYDPEIPVVSLVDLKVVRNVEVKGDNVRVVITPTFAGCPALHMMKEEIRSRLLKAGFRSVDVEVSYSERWSTNMLDESVREKLRVFGIAPPPRVEIALGADAHTGALADALHRPAACPYCGSVETRLESFFGSTLCKQIFFCEKCRQSFDRFKPL